MTGELLMQRKMVASTRRDGGVTVIGVQVDGSAETEAQSVQLRVQHSDSNITSGSTGNKQTKNKVHEGTFTMGV